MAPPSKGGPASKKGRKIRCEDENRVLRSDQDCREEEDRTLMSDQETISNRALRSDQVCCDEEDRTLISDREKALADQIKERTEELETTNDGNKIADNLESAKNENEVNPGNQEREEDHVRKEEIAKVEEVPMGKKGVTFEGTIENTMEGRNVLKPMLERYFMITDTGNVATVSGMKAEEAIVRKAKENDQCTEGNTKAAAAGGYAKGQGQNQPLRQNGRQTDADRIPGQTALGRNDKAQNMDGNTKGKEQVGVKKEREQEGGQGGRGGYSVRGGLGGRGGYEVRGGKSGGRMQNTSENEGRKLYEMRRKRKAIELKNNFQSLGGMDEEGRSNKANFDPGDSKNSEGDDEDPDYSGNEGDVSEGSEESDEGVFAADDADETPLV
nr:hypothetical protein Iba_chr13eCG11510 [Ipomoea batatas]